MPLACSVAFSLICFQSQNMWVHTSQLPPATCVGPSRAACLAQSGQMCYFPHSTLNRWNVPPRRNGTGWIATSAPSSLHVVSLCSL